MSILPPNQQKPDEPREAEAREDNQERQLDTSLFKDESSGQSLVSPDNKLPLYGEDETQVSEGGEDDLHKYHAKCTKNQGHTNFHSIKELTVKHLPKGFQDDDLYNIIKITAKLAVRIAVKMISPSRPEFWPGTTKLYPMYEKKHSTVMRCGTGEITVRKVVDGVVLDSAGSQVNFGGTKYETDSKVCPCTNCERSGNPSSVWWEIIVTTATHVVFDDIEAKHTTCTLFYDEEGSQVVELKEFWVDDVDVKRDTCLLKSVTCDPLGEELYNMAVDRWGLSRKILEKYKSRSDMNWNFIVSHPHGCYKRVTFGEMKEDDTTLRYSYNDTFDMKQLVYKTATCPGSSGAMVNCMKTYHGHVHSGTLNSGLNCSGVDLYLK